MTILLFALCTIHQKPTAEEFKEKVFTNKAIPLTEFNLEYKTSDYGLEYGQCEFKIKSGYYPNDRTAPGLRDSLLISKSAEAAFESDITTAVAFDNFTTVNSSHIDSGSDVFEAAALLTDYHAGISDTDNIRSLSLFPKQRTDTVEIHGSVVFMTQPDNSLSPEFLEYLFDNFDSLADNSINVIPSSPDDGLKVYAFSFNEVAVKGFEFSDILNTINSFDEVESASLLTTGTYPNT